VALKKIAIQEKLTYLDLASLFSDKDGKLDKNYSIDGLHINGAGYQKWKDAIEKYIIK
jgi:lysophospholipase L1-like esterase